jgi:hypothetical protein
MTTTDTRKPLWQRTWVRVTGSIAALALVAGAGAGWEAAGRGAVVRWGAAARYGAGAEATARTLSAVSQSAAIARCAARSVTRPEQTAWFSAFSTLSFGFAAGRSRARGWTRPMSRQLQRDQVV